MVALTPNYGKKSNKGVELPELFIGNRDFQFIRAAIKQADWREVGGLGVVVLEKDEDGRSIPVVKHLRLLRQTISASEVDWHPNAHAEYLEWLYTPESDGGAGFTENQYGVYSWHSHGTMGTFFSGTDVDFINKTGLTVPWIFSSVFNTKGESNHRLDVFGEAITNMCPALTEQHIYWDKAKLTVLADVESAPYLDLLDEIDENMEKKIKAIREEAEEAAKEVKSKLGELTKVSMESVVETVKAEFKEFVKVYSYHGGPNVPKGQHHLPPGSTSQSQQNGGSPKQQQNKNSTSNKRGSKRGKKEDEGNNFRDKLHYPVYDTAVKCLTEMTLRQILFDDTVILTEDLPAEILQKLTEDERADLMVRPTYKEWVEALESGHYGFHGGYS